MNAASPRESRDAENSHATNWMLSRRAGERARGTDEIRLLEGCWRRGTMTGERLRMQVEDIALLQGEWRLVTTTLMLQS
jgi:hypothetical protein